MRIRREHIEEDPTGLSQAVRDFNEHTGPARLFFNRNSEVFYVRTYLFGGDRWWGEMCDSLDTVELYRKTSAYPDVKVTPDELRMMRSEVRPYSAW